MCLKSGKIMFEQKYGIVDEEICLKSFLSHVEQKIYNMIPLFRTNSVILLYDSLAVFSLFWRIKYFLDICN